MTYLIVSCPHCSHEIYILKKELNCRIFRHGIYKKNLKQIDPHMKKEGCDRLKKEDLIYGCGKPFKVVENNNEFKAEICGYI
jgi:hypothetical protein